MKRNLARAWKTVDVLCDWCGSYGDKIGHVTYKNGTFATDAPGLKAGQATRHGACAVVLKGKGLDTRKNNYTLAIGTGPDVRSIGSSTYNPPGLAEIEIGPGKTPKRASLYRSRHTRLRLAGVSIRQRLGRRR